MSKMFGVRLSDEDAARLDKVIARYETTPQEYLKAIILGELARAERTWIQKGVGWLKGERPGVVTTELVTTKRI